MKVIEYIKQNGLQKLTEEFGVVVKIYPEGLIVLNYDQIISPKNEITNECRGLILDNAYNIVSRSFDRFFNYGENFTTFDPSRAVAYEKVDGSLIKIYNWKGTWLISTRGTAFAESKVNGWDITFEEMVLKSLGCDADSTFGWDFDYLCQKYLDPRFTYICEVTGVENRVVTRYQDYTLWYLACRDNQSGNYYNGYSREFGFKEPRRFNFTSVEECLETAKHLPDLQEGYVMYQDGVPVCKVKSPAYVAVHHIRGEGLSPKRIAELVVINEQEEYLTYFEEDRKFFTPYVEELKHTLLLAERVYLDASGKESQKEFALEVKDYPFAFILFQARKSNENDIYKIFNSFDKNAKVKFLLGLMGEKMPKLIITCGVSGSGKSTYARELQALDETWEEINRDFWRFTLFCRGQFDWNLYKFSKDKEKRVTEECDKEFDEFVEQGLNIIVSNTNLNQKDHDYWKAKADAAGYEFEEKYFWDVSYLYMRTTGDNRSDRIVKEELFWQYLEPYWNIVAAIDDLPRVVRLQHDLGIPNVINVQRGYDEF